MLVGVGPGQVWRSFTSVPADLPTDDDRRPRWYSRLRIKPERLCEAPADEQPRSAASTTTLPLSILCKATTAPTGPKHAVKTAQDPRRGVPYRAGKDRISFA